jgi:hypothetical protein
MAKAQMVCPFSKKPCIACAIFRGRHYYLCFAPNFNGHSWGSSKTTGFKSNGSTRNFDVEKPPVLPRSSKWIHNVEDLVERSEG